jgi:acetyl-CoA acetyltransferase
MSFITGVGLTSYGKHEGSSSLDLMSKAAEMAIADAGLKRSEIDGILCGYSTVSPHIMLATVFAEHFGIRPSYAHAVQVGGATGLAMTMLAHHLVDAGIVKHCWWSAARTVSPVRVVTPRSRRWRRSGIPITR